MGFDEDREELWWNLLILPRKRQSADVSGRNCGPSHDQIRVFTGTSLNLLPTMKVLKSGLSSCRPSPPGRVVGSCLSHRTITWKWCAAKRWKMASVLSCPPMASLARSEE